MIFVVFRWRTIALFQAQLEERLVESVAAAVCLQHGIDRQELSVTYRSA